MIKANHWLNTLFCLTLIATPALIAFYFWLPDWNEANQKATWFYWVIGLSFLVYTFLICLIMIKLKLLSLELLNLALPLACVLMMIFVSSHWNLALRFLIVISMIFIALPTNIFVTRQKVKYRKNILKKSRKHH